MADSTLRKYIWLINTILDAGKLTFREISEKWNNSSLNYNGTELSKRTFHNHRMAILTELGVDIQCTCMRENSQYYIANQDEIGKNDVLNWLTDSMATEQLLLENKSIANKIILEPIPGGCEWLTLLSQALRDNVRIVFQYTSFHSPTKNDTNRTLEPLCLKLFKRRWYVLGQTIDSGKRLIFALDRITNLELTTERFEYPEDFSAKDFFANFYGICSDECSRPTRVILKCYREFPKYMRSLPLHHSQEELENGEDFTTFGFYMSPAYDFIQEILSHGNDIEVLAPVWLRNLVKEKAEALTALYK
ncbi:MULTISPECIES: YafY family protein [Muribaculum]|jgi:putative transcriptional regulator|uniref:helix-turn-helix transcriptional regulator n=3 Tax=Muribaculaceae TaxID=2005473 RepID=UPI000F49B550|nr:MULTISPECIES: WYL domain-containing protein [Muribaculum]ROT16170.1 WYL domain-containing protein [Muribaculaceae bacterium Isolate-102 (HZI)]